MRYFVELAYRGTHYHGWQRQPNGISVQEELEKAFSTILNTPIQVVGCGRTDAGVHASQFFLHFDSPQKLPDNFVSRLNKFLSSDIGIFRIFKVPVSAHARFDAFYRSYAYHVHFNKDPFLADRSLFFYSGNHIDHILLQDAAKTLLKYQDFFPFCKTGHDVKTLRCELHHSEWEFGEGRLTYHIAANRFLRGMVRLIVGMCLNVGLGKMSIEDVRIALENQTRLPKSWSVEPQGLFLTEVRYPEMISELSSGTDRNFPLHKAKE